MSAFEDKDVQRAILAAIAAKPTGSITNAELRSAVADALATQISLTFLRAYRRYGPFPLGGPDLDRYYAETAVVAAMNDAVRDSRCSGSSR